MRNHYDTLNVAESAPDEVIRAAYKALAMKFHPDRNNGSAESRQIMQDVNDAYNVLSDPWQRQEYDKLLFGSRETPPPTPRLWNPNAAANWSLLLTPIFGAWLHAQNWKELDQLDRAKKSMIWVYIGFVFLIVALFLPDNFGSGPGIIFIIAWYFSIAKGQVKYLKENNISYNKKAWGQPLLLGIAGLVIYFAIAIGVITATEPTPNEVLNEPSITEVLESESVSLVTQIVREQLGGAAMCKAVSINKALSEDFYHAVAYLDNGNELKIVIELKGDQIIVTIPDQ